jgi:hypothetical protein
MLIFRFKYGIRPLYLNPPPPPNQFTGRKFFCYHNTSNALCFCIMSVKVIHVHGYDRASISVRDGVMPSPYSCSFFMFIFMCLC